MDDFIGLGLFAVGVFLLKVGGPWFRARFEPEDGAHYMPGDFYALVVTTFILAGASLVLADIANAWRDGNLTHAFVGLAAVAATVLAFWFVPDLLRRRRTAA